MTARGVERPCSNVVLPCFHETELWGFRAFPVAVSVMSALMIRLVLHIVLSGTSRDLELRHQALELLSHGSQLLRRRRHLFGGRRSALRNFVDALHGSGHLLGIRRLLFGGCRYALAHLAHALQRLGQLLDGADLLFHGLREGRNHLPDFLGAFPYLLHRGLRSRRGLHSLGNVLYALLYQRLDLLCGRGTSIGKFAHLVGHHRESPAVLACPSSFDRCVEGKEVGLVRDIGDNALSEIRKSDINTFSLWLKQDKGLMANTVNNVLSAGTVAFRWAARNDVISKNPAEGLMGFSGKHMKRGVLTDSEVEQLFALAWPDKHSKVANMLAMSAGLRAGEILACVPPRGSPIRSTLWLQANVSYESCFLHGQEALTYMHIMHIFSHGWGL